MTALTVKDLYSIEQYDRIRPEFRAKVMQHKDSRRVALGAWRAARPSRLGTPVV